MNAEPALFDTFEKLGIALGLGLLVGMQRQRTDSRLAGIRTFPLITMFGTITGLLALRFGGWVVAAGLISLACLVIAGNLGKSPPADPGVTTEVAMLLMFGIGTYLVAGQASVAVVLAGTIVVLLHFKPEMHAFARRMGEKDYRAIIQFVLVSLVILPVLPNQAFGPYQVLNPFKIWLLAVLIVAMSLVGYVAYKFLGARRGSLVGGLFGGMISSTATTVTYARYAREAPENNPTATLAIVIASAVVFLRVLIIAGVVAPDRFLEIAGPIGTMLGAVALIAAAVWLFSRNEPAAMPPHENPSELRPAIIFALLFAAILLGVAAAKDHFGTRGLYAVATISGLTDMDAITLSTLQMPETSQPGSGVAWRMILLAAMANLVFKGATVAVIGNRQLLVRVAALFAIAFVVGWLILWLWPGGAA